MSAVYISVLFLVLAGAGLLGWVIFRLTKVLPNKTIQQTVGETAGEKMSREEFVATLIRLAGATSIDENAVPDGVTMSQLNIVVAIHFGMITTSTLMPTVGMQIDNLYQQYLRN